MLNTGYIPDYLRSGKLCLLSKTPKNQVSMDNIRLLTIQSHLVKVLEKAIKVKIAKIKSGLLDSREM
jgi:hypothetical protein